LIKAESPLVPSASSAEAKRSFFDVISSFVPQKTASTDNHDCSQQALLLLHAFEESSDGWFWSTDARGHLTYLSDSICRLLGNAREKLLGRQFSELFVPVDGDSSGRRTLPFRLARHVSFKQLMVRSAIADLDRSWSVSGRPCFTEQGRFVGYRGGAVDVTEHRKSSAHASRLAQYDALTGLPNRRRMSEILETVLQAAQRGGRQCAVLLIDLDRFKQVNDTLGHPAGDQLLKQVSERLVQLVGDKERVFRLGGDEFQIIVDNGGNRGIIGDLAADIIRTVSEPYLIEGSRCIIGASIGIAIGPVDGSDKDALIRNADLALYASKEGGRGRFRFFSSALLEEAEDRRSLEEDLRDALQRGELSVAYQPIVDARTNRMTGVEALLRWQHPKRGAVSPALFIPIAEEAGLIEPIGEWVLRTACEDAAAWPETLRVAVNVSPIQFGSEAFPATVVNALAASGLTPGRLELEITEGVFLGQSADTDSAFAALKGIGVRLALDDFGTGYSSLGYLQSAPFDKIKIDQSFVRAATTPESRNSAIIAAIVALAEALDMETTAEGVEYMDQLALIRDLRVSHAQGWVYSKALSCADLVRKLEEGDWVIEPDGPARQRSERQAMYRKVGVIHGSRFEEALVRNLSETGALIEASDALKPETLVVVDFGDGQLSFGRVIRSHGKQHGIAFEQQLVDDGDGGLCTSHRVSPQVLSTIGLPSRSNPVVEESGEHPTPIEALANHLGLTLAPQRPVESRRVAACYWADASPGDDGAPTFRDLSARYLESLQADDETRERAKRDLRNHILPRFGQLRPDEVAEADLYAWLAAKVGVEAYPEGTDDRLHSLLSQIWALAVKLGVPGAEPNPLEGQSWREWKARYDVLASEDALSLLDAAQDSSNRQLKFILALMITTSVRQGELLKATWDDVDLEERLWTLPAIDIEKPRRIRLGRGALALLSALPRWENCSLLVPNPATRKPYRSLQRSWEAVKVKAGLPHLEIDDVRYCAADEAGILERLNGGRTSPAHPADPASA
jgi:diguanylate cyclase (GGDEF)-like protein/PAS domain S-box-containing protein